MGRPQDGRKVSSLQFSESSPGAKPVRGARIAVDPAKIRPAILPQQQPEKRAEKKPSLSTELLLPSMDTPVHERGSPQRSGTGLTRTAYHAGAGKSSPNSPKFWTEQKQQRRRGEARRAGGGSPQGRRPHAPREPPEGAAGAGGEAGENPPKRARVSGKSGSGEAGSARETLAAHARSSAPG